MRHFLHITTILILLFAGAISAKARPEYVKAKNIRGWTLKSRGHDVWNKLDKDDRLFVGTEIKTAKESGLTILFRTGMQITINEKTQLKLVFLKPDSAVVKQYKGIVDYQISPSKQKIFKVMTRLGEVVSGNAVFSVEVNFRTREILINTKKGELTVSNPKKKIAPVTLKAGEKLRIGRSDTRFSVIPAPPPKPKWPKVKYTLVDGSEAEGFLAYQSATHITIADDLDGKGRRSMAKHFFLKIEDESGKVIFDALTPAPASNQK